uniref:Uncharacterized protein n=1 Tax=Romanomermis culicivorax TaxID=13658 RepID=A0A915KU22_ROMCU
MKQANVITHKKIMQKCYCSPTAPAGYNFDIELIIVLKTPKNQGSHRLYPPQISEMHMYHCKGNRECYSTRYLGNREVRGRVTCLLEREFYLLLEESGRSGNKD